MIHRPADLAFYNYHLKLPWFLPNQYWDNLKWKDYTLKMLLLFFNQTKLHSEKNTKNFPSQILPDDGLTGGPPLTYTSACAL